MREREREPLSNSLGQTREGNVVALNQSIDQSIDQESCKLCVVNKGGMELRS